MTTMTKGQNDSFTSYLAQTAGETPVWFRYYGDGEWSAGFASEVAAHRVGYKYRKLDARVEYSSNMGSWAVSV